MNMMNESYDIKKEQDKYDKIVEKHLGWSKEKEDNKSPFRARRYKTVFSILKKIVKKKLKLKKDIKILDLGCGSGETTYIISKMFPSLDIEGVDISNKAIEHAKKYYNNSNIIFTVSGIEDKEFLNKKKNYFDIIIFNGVLEHIKDDLAALNYIYNLCAKDGESIILTVTYQKYWSKIDELVGHYRRYEPSELKKIAEKTKFTLKEELITGYPFSLMLYLLHAHKTKENNAIYRPTGLKKTILKISSPLLYFITGIDTLFDFTKKGHLIIITLQKK